MKERKSRPSGVNSPVRRAGPTMLCEYAMPVWNRKREACGAFTANYHLGMFPHLLSPQTIEQQQDRVKKLFYFARKNKCGNTNWNRKMELAGFWAIILSPLIAVLWLIEKHKVVFLKEQGL